VVLEQAHEEGALDAAHLEEFDPGDDAVVVAARVTDDTVEADRRAPVLLGQPEVEVDAITDRDLAPGHVEAGARDRQVADDALLAVAVVDEVVEAGLVPHREPARPLHSAARMRAPVTEDRSLVSLDTSAEHGSSYLTVR